MESNDITTCSYCFTKSFFVGKEPCFCASRKAQISTVHVGLAGTMKRSIGNHMQLLFHKPDCVGKEPCFGASRFLICAMEKLANGLLQRGEPGLLWMKLEVFMFIQACWLSCL